MEVERYYFGSWFMVEKAEKYKNERDKIIADNKELNNQVDNIKAEYKNKEFVLEWKYKSKIRSLEKETNILIDQEKQLKKDKKEKVWDLEL